MLFARHTLDYDFLLRNPDYKHLVSTIDTGRHNWLDFDLTENAKIDLFKRGVKCAAKFLTTFKWEKYKEIRSSMAKAHKASDY
jgi:NTE family protein